MLSNMDIFGANACLKDTLHFLHPKLGCVWQLRRKVL
jgi:hypothetical protein